MAVEITSGDIFSPEQLTKHSKIYAGPGAGKTHFLVENVKNIVETNSLITKSRTRKVLCITYTNAAVDEIKRRLDRFTDYVEAYTIHGFILEHIIQPFQRDLRELMLSDFGITVADRGKISSQVEGLGILHGLDKDDIYEFIKKTNPSEFEHDTFGYSKKAMGDTEVDNETFCLSIAKETPYEMKLKAPTGIDARHIKPLKQYIWSVVKKLTHNEILYFGYRILESNPTALYATRVKFPFVFVDEFQDTNPLQTMLIKLIGQKSTVIKIVGDVAQSIYSFQGAKPTYFVNFAIEGKRELVEYVINGNRRSTENVVNFCNYLRQSDKAVVQTSVKSYKDDKEKSLSESKKIHFLIGNSPAIHEDIYNVIKDGGVVLTRAWAAAFNYIDGICDAQVKMLKDIYNSYYNSPIQLRDEIAEHNNVTWVRAFRFIFNLWEGYVSGSFIDIVRALKIYVDIDVRKLTPKVVFQIGKLSDNVFSNVTEQSLTTKVVEIFNSEIKKMEFEDFCGALFEPGFKIPIFDDLDKDKLIDAVNGLTWDTSYKLFSEVFSDNSKYMTVHQAKGLEWKKVIVSVTPNNFDKTNLKALYSAPQLSNENPAEEFARMYYVACSRAKEDLYIHISSGCDADVIETTIKSFVTKTGKVINYEIVT
ncbi:ATP-dependent helicase [Dehalobacter restrictus]|uniref:ATP-dependent helicase n=1 Tax=Dehalobacter restrictus TaxID=55583 RepID=UPI00338FCE3F